MKTAVIAVASSLCAAIIIFLIMNIGLQREKDAADLALLLSVEQTMQKRIDDISSQIQFQVKAFSDVVAAHKDFSLRILAENDRTSPVITEMASQFIKPMGFSVLEITDSAWSILSSGHFPASAGNSCAEKAGQLSDKATACTDNIMGTPTLTLQARNGFTIAGFLFYVMGGITIDASLLTRLTPNKKVKLLFKKGGEYIGMDNIGSISAITDHRIIINDKKFLAAELPIPSAVTEEKMSLIVLVDK